MAKKTSSDSSDRVEQQKPQSTLMPQAAELNKRKGAENKSVESSAQFRSVFEQASVGIVFVGLDKRFFRCNAAFSNFVGYSEDELIGKTIADITHSEDVRLGMKEMKQMVDGELASHSLQKRYVRKDGKIVWGELSISVVRDANNRPLYFLPLIQDISKRKWAEETLIKSEERYRRLIETTDTGYVILDNKGFVVDANPEYVRLSGHEKLDEILGRSVVEWTADEEKETNAQAVAACLKTGFVRHFEITYVDNIGNRTPVEINATVMEEAGKKRILTLCRDITERKLAEKSIRESEEKYRVLFEGSAHGILSIDIETGRFTYANPAVCRMFGYSEMELGRLGIADIHPKESLRFVESEFDAMVRNEKMMSSAIPCLRNDGTVFYADITAADTSINGRRFLVGFFADVTKRKRMEDALKESEMRYRALVEFSPDAITHTDLNGKILMCNSQTALLHGYDRAEDLIGKTAFDLFPPDELERAGANLQKTLAGTIVKDIEYRFVKKDGSQFHGELSAKAITDAAGKPASFIAITRDITARKQAEKLLQESEERFSKAFKITPYSYMIANMEDGAIIDVNDAFTTISGFTREEALAGSTLKLNFWVDEEDRKRMMATLRDNGVVERMETRLRAKSGKIVTALLFAHMIRLGRKSCILSIMEDITARKQAEAALRESENKFRSTFENSNIGVALVGLDGHYLLVNQALSDIFGYTVEELLSTGFFDITHPDDIERSRTIFLQVLNGKDKSVRFSKRYIHKDGHTIGAEISSSTILSAAGEPLYFISHISDITARKLAEDALRESEENFRVLFNESPMPTLMSEVPSGRMNFVNKRLAESVGRTVEDLIGKTPNELHLLKDPSDQERLTRLIAEKGSVDNVEFDKTYPDGSPGAVSISMRLVTVRGRLHCMTMIQDITERKMAENAVAAEKERLAVTLHSIGDAVIATDVRGDIVLMNKVAEDLTGWPLSEATEKPLSDIFNVVNEMTREHLENPVEKVLSSGNIVELANHTLLISRDGTERVIADSGAPIKGINNKIIGVVLVFRDITEKQKFMDTIQRTAKLDSLGILAGGIAHDFNNLLTGIYGYVDLARSVCKDTKISEYLEAMLSTMKRAKSLTLQLLTFAKGGSPVQKITPVISFIQETARFALSGSNISCRFSLAEDLRPCNIDKNQIAQVIDNIVINAQQAMPDGGSIEIGAMNISFAENEHPPLVKGDYVKVSIKDFGIGIPKEIMPRIFDPFYTTKIKGHGLGLATCFSIINRHGGCIDVESRPGKGSTFHICLPASSEAVIADPAVSNAHKGSGTIIVMDDEEVVREMFRQMLESMGYAVVTKNGGREAVDFYINEKVSRQFAAMIFDLTIPGGMGGMEAVKEIRKLNKEIPIFVASGYADNSALKNPVEYGFTASISKPFTQSELSEMLNKYLKSGLSGLNYLQKG